MRNWMCVMLVTALSLALMLMVPGRAHAEFDFASLDPLAPGEQ